MKLETFFEKFDQFVDAPDAVAKMRELVLELAVQGKLVEQMPAEGDGHALLRQIHKKNPPSATETDAEPVDVELASFPSSWAPSKLGEVAEIIRGVTFPGSAKSETRSNGDVACLRTASVQAEIDWDDLIYISPTYVSREDQWVMIDDVMISMANSYALVGKVAIVREVPQKATFGAFLAAIRPILIEPYFLLYVLRSPRMQEAFRASSSQTTNIANISLGRMRPLPFPLPPLAEQKRIVAKVDELMALCDRLEAQQQERDTRHAVLARASLARFADAPTPANLHFLFHPSYAIPPADLRKSILTLAVQGKLVPQDPNDEPADELICRLCPRPGAKSTKRLKRDTAMHSKDCVGEFLLPSGWVTTNLQTIADVNWGNTSITKASYTETGFTAFSATGPDGFLSFAEFDGPGIVLSAIGARSGKCFFADGKWTAIKNTITILPHKPVDTHWLFTVVNVEDSWKKRGGAQPFIALKDALSLRIDLPPLAEQRRIVAKVEQLMALVDALETQLAASRATAANLLSALVTELTSRQGGRDET